MAAETYKRLAAQAGNGTIGTASTVYTVASGSTIISSIVICNTSSTGYTYSLAVSQNATTSGGFGSSGNAGTGLGGYIVFQAPIAGNDTIILSLGITLDATNKLLLASSSNASVVFNVFGVEMTA